MRLEMAQHVYPPYRLKPSRELANQLMQALGVPGQTDVVPPTYLIFLRGEQLGVNLFADLDISRQKALHGGQRYEWFAPVSFDDELDVTVSIGNITEKQARRGPIWFVDVNFEYHRVRDGELVVRELTRLIKQS